MYFVVRVRFASLSTLAGHLDSTALFHPATFKTYRATSSKFPAGISELADTKPHTVVVVARRSPYNGRDKDELKGEAKERNDKAALKVLTTFGKQVHSGAIYSIYLNNHKANSHIPVAGTIGLHPNTGAKLFSQFWWKVPIGGTVWLVLRSAEALSISPGAWSDFHFANRSWKTIVVIEESIIKEHDETLWIPSRDGTSVLLVFDLIDLAGALMGNKSSERARHFIRLLVQANDARQALNLSGPRGRNADAIGHGSPGRNLLQEMRLAAVEYGIRMCFLPPGCRNTYPPGYSNTTSFKAHIITHMKNIEKDTFYKANLPEKDDDLQLFPYICTVISCNPYMRNHASQRALYLHTMVMHQSVWNRELKKNHPTLPVLRRLKGGLLDFTKEYKELKAAGIYDVHADFEDVDCVHVTGSPHGAHIEKKGGKPMVFDLDEVMTTQESRDESGSSYPEPLHLESDSDLNDTPAPPRHTKISTRSGMATYEDRPMQTRSALRNSGMNPSDVLLPSIEYSTDNDNDDGGSEYHETPKRKPARRARPSGKGLRGR
ncbi:hypothetical protein VTL71DRAFT_7984 [Oculimacula yallundae]|uniref:Uncharacterized protein n=1 Tax=Oculimacula yallundae TaxID=86028 RepID=A0ABR4CYJ9_9HELO